jgi:hypothetical protein
MRKTVKDMTEEERLKYNESMRKLYHKKMQDKDYRLKRKQYEASKREKLKEKAIDFIFDTQLCC